MPLIPDGKSILEIAQMCASVGFPIISLGAVLVAVWAIRANRRVQREQTARNAHLRYLELALTYPKLAYPEGASVNLNEEKHDDSYENFERYEWFVSFLLSTAAYIWESVGYAHPLSRLMRLQVAYHWAYIEHCRHRHYLKIWYASHALEIDEGIALGKKDFPELRARTERQLSVVTP